MAERKRNYPTGNPNGMSYINNRWVYTGPQGYRVTYDPTPGNNTGEWTVLAYHGAHTTPLHGGTQLTEDAAHALAARLANTTPHPPQN